MDGGGAEDVDDDSDRGVGALGDEGALEAFEGTACDTDGVAFLHAGREVDGTGGVEEHVLELTHLVVGDDGEGSVSFDGSAFTRGGVEDVEEEETWVDMPNLPPYKLGSGLLTEFEPEIEPVG